MPGRRLGIQAHYAQAIARPSPLAITITSPSSGASVQGIITVRGGLTATPPTVEISVDGDAYRPCSVSGRGKWQTSVNTACYSSGARTLTVRAKDAGGNVLASASSTMTVAAQSIIPGIGHYGSSSYANTTNKDKMSAFQEDDAAIGSAQTNPTLSLTWCHAVNVYPGEVGDIGVPYSEISANGWLLHDSVGNPIYYPNDSSVLTDVGHPDYQARLIDRWINNPNQLGPGVGIFSKYPQCDGVMIDNIIGTYFGHAGPNGTGPLTYSTKYPTNASYRTAMLSMIRTVGAALQNASFYVNCNVASYDDTVGLPNHDNGDQWIWWVRQFSDCVNGVVNENLFFANGALRPIGNAWYQYWAEWVQTVADVQSLGIDWHHWSYPPSITSSQFTRYDKGTFLMNWEPRSGTTFYNHPEDNNAADVWSTDWTLDVGLPTGDKTQPQSGLYKRVFQKGATTYIVLVNANTSGSLTQDSHTVGFGDAYIGVP